MKIPTAFNSPQNVISDIHRVREKAKNRERDQGDSLLNMRSLREEKTYGNMHIAGVDVCVCIKYFSTAHLSPIFGPFCPIIGYRYSSIGKKKNQYSWSTKFSRNM